MSQSTYLPDGIQHARTCLMMTAIDHCHIRILFQSLFDISQIRLLKHTALQVNMRDMIHLTDLYCTGIIGTVINHQHLLALWDERIDTYVNIDGT